MLTRWKVTKEDRTSPQAQDKYSKTYIKGATVEANRNTLGLMTFKTRGQAEEWSRNVFEPKILEVKPIGRGRIPIVLAHRDFLPLFYKHRRRLNTNKIAKLLGLHITRVNADYKVDHKDIILWAVPKGTICYPAVKVLT
jgi:hypothetical protein